MSIRPNLYLTFKLILLTDLMKNPFGLLKRLSPDEVDELLNPLSVDNPLQLMLFNLMSLAYCYNQSDSKSEKRSVKSAFRPLIQSDTAMALRASHVYKSMTVNQRTDFFTTFGQLLQAMADDQKKEVNE